MYGPWGPRKGILMIVFVLVSIKEIVAKGRDFAWPRPEKCPRCEGRRIWCHGFVTAFFDGFSEQVVLALPGVPVRDASATVGVSGTGSGVC